MAKRPSRLLREESAAQTTMVRLTLDTRSFQDVLDKLRSLPAKVAGEIGRPALRAGANVFLERAKVLAPVYRPRRRRSKRFNTFAGRRPSVLWIRRPRKSPLPIPGLLRRSLRTRAMKRKKFRVGYLMQTSSSGNLFTGRAYYGAFLEFGSGKGRTPKKPKLNRHSERGRSAWRNYVGRVRHHRAAAHRIEPMRFIGRSFSSRERHAAYVVESEMRRRLEAVMSRRTA